MGKCPHCGSRRIRRRYREHRRYKWRCRSCNRVFRRPKSGILLWLGVAVVVAAATAFFAAQQGMIALPTALSPVERQIDRVSEVVIPTATSLEPVATLTTHLRAASKSVAENAPRAQATIDAGARTAAKAVSDALQATAVSPSETTTTPSTLPGASPEPTITPNATPVPTQTVEPKPDELPPIEAATTVEGYWADGTAKVRLQMTLPNDAELPPKNNQPISVSCTQGGEPIESCDTNTATSPATGGVSAATELTLRMPMGLASVSIDYGGEAPYELSVEVPERILGVDRDTWACYSDRATSNNAEGSYGCYGWNRPTVEKWRSGSTVRVWATGNDNYIRAFKETLDEQLASVLNLTFEWVEDEWDADYVAILGVPESDERPDRWASCPHAWGCGGAIDVRNGEVRKADLIVYHLESHDRFLDDYPKLKRVLNGIFIHEALHGLAPTGHAERSSVVLSVMRSAGYLTSIDKAILSLNSHRLIEPGMTMSQVEPLIVFRDELLDPPQEPEPSTYDLLDRTLATLQKVDTVRMKIKGGWSGGRCDSRFGKRQWATFEIAGFDAPDDPRLAYLQDGGDKFFIFYSDKAAAALGDGWQHWQESRSGWKLISREELWDSTAWWVRNSKLHHTISELLWYYDEDAVELVNWSNGEMTLSAQYNPSETSPYGLKDEWLTLNMVIDEDSYEVKRFEWIHHNREWDYCHTYTEEGIDLEYGVDIEIPNAIVESSQYALPVIKTNRE